MKRLFLLYIVALMGTLNVLAWEKTVWQGYFDCSGSWTQQLDVSKDLFADLENGDKVKFYAYETQTGAQIQIAHGTGTNVGDKLVVEDNFTSTYTYDTETKNDASWFKANDFYIKGQYYKLYRITI
ncbi:MAG: hypothetical protein II546_03390, partial [Prevotella sp.]|nr:hypothetical protein [Prevotella sp.]